MLNPNNGPQACRELQIPREATHLSSSLSELMDDMEKLTQRLQSVLSPEYPSAVCEKSSGICPPPEMPLTELGEQLRGSWRRVENIRGSVANLLTRLEV